MDQKSVRIEAVLRELADLGLRIGEQAGELARLTKERQPAGSSRTQSPSTPRKDATNNAAKDAANPHVGPAFWEWKNRWR